MSVIFSTDQSGANTNICSGQSYTFNFSVPTAQDVYSANFTMKKGSSTSLPITVTIYNQPNGGGSVVGSSTVLDTSVTQSFAPIEFLFSGITLSSNISYSLTISSAVSCSGSNPYSFKAGNFQVLDKATGSVLNIGYAIAAALSGVATVNSSAALSTNANSSQKTSSTMTSSAGKILGVSTGTLCGSSLSGSLIVDLAASSKMASECTGVFVLSQTSFIAAELKSEVSASSWGGLIIETGAELKSEVSANSSGGLIIETSVGIYCNSSLSASLIIDLSASSEIASECSCVSALNQSLFATAELKSEVLANSEGSLGMEASAKMESEHIIFADLSKQISTGSQIVSEISAQAFAELEVFIGAELKSESLLVASLGGSKRKRRRFGSGHYTINKGLFVRRSWTPFIYAANDNNVNISYDGRT